MENVAEKIIVDPDYEINEYDRRQIQTKELKDREDYIEKIKGIIKCEFDKELKFKANQLELIQQRISKTQKTLHLLRYVLVTSYYNNQETKINESVEVESQDRIHPAIKKLFANNSPNNYLYNMSTRRKRNKQKNFYENMVIQESDEQTMKQDSIEIKFENDTDYKQEEVHQESLTDTKIIDTSVRNRKKVKHRIIVGNISKWMPSDNDDDKSTHKWMVYVRGPKDTPNVSHIIDKVVFYLHPSYKPNDIVEATESPFHLSRRGWGEFPLRVQLYFTCPLNKPLDIIHNLKLDKTYTGRQTLGNETVVDVHLYSFNVEQTELRDDNQFGEQQSNIDFNPEENSLRKNTTIQKSSGKRVDFTNAPQSDTKIINLEYPKKNENPHLNSIHIEHSYSINLNLQNQSKHSIHSKSNDDMDTIPSSQKNTEVIVVNGRTIEMKRCKRTQHSLLKTSQKRLKINSSEELVQTNTTPSFHIIGLPNEKFNCVIEALPFLLKRLPLIVSYLNDFKYKCKYPYVANSFEEFSKWNIEKRCSSEWSRARVIKKLLSSSNCHDKFKWSTKNILWYARTHGYTPLVDYKIFKDNSFVNEQILLEKSSHHYDRSNKKHRNIDSSEVPVDVIDCDTNSVESNTKPEKVDYSISENNSTYSFIRQLCLDVGVILKPEEISPNILLNTAEIVLQQAIKCLAENIIRDSRAVLVLEGNFSENSDSIDVMHVKKSLKQRPELSIFLKSKSNIKF